MTFAHVFLSKVPTPKKSCVHRPICQKTPQLDHFLVPQNELLGASNTSIRGCQAVLGGLMHHLRTWCRNGQRLWKSKFCDLSLICQLSSGLSERHFWVRFLTKSLKSLRMPRQPYQNGSTGRSGAEWTCCWVKSVQRIKINCNFVFWFKLQICQWYCNTKRLLNNA